MNTVTYFKDGKEIEIVSLLPDLTIGTPVIVSLETLKRLTNFLPKANFESIKERIINDIRVTSNIKEIVELFEDEIMFQRSVNLITKAHIVDLKVEFEDRSINKL